MFFHVIENAQRNGVKGYRFVKTYRQYGALEKSLLKTGEPVWVVESAFPDLFVLNSTHRPLTQLGGFVANYWNTGGWGTTVMPVLPWLG